MRVTAVTSVPRIARAAESPALAAQAVWELLIAVPRGRVLCLAPQLTLCTNQTPRAFHLPQLIKIVLWLHSHVTTVLYCWGREE